MAQMTVVISRPLSRWMPRAVRRDWDKAECRSGCKYDRFRCLHSSSPPITSWIRGSWHTATWEGSLNSTLPSERQCVSNANDLLSKGEKTHVDSSGDGADQSEVRAQTADSPLSSLTGKKALPFRSWMIWLATGLKKSRISLGWGMNCRKSQSPRNPLNSGCFCNESVALELSGKHSQVSSTQLFHD